MTDGTLMPDGVTRVRAPNPSPLTLDGTNTYVVGGWVVDPGPEDGGHLDPGEAGVGGGGIEGIGLTHSHPDHAEGAPALAARAFGVEVVRPSGGDAVGPFEVIATPGHSPDHVSLLWGRVLFSGDTVLGAGSVFVGGGDGSMAAYLDSLRRLLALDLEAICPGHGPVIWDPRAKLEEYIAHRLRAGAALGGGVGGPAAGVGGGGVVGGGGGWGAGRGGAPGGGGGGLGFGGGGSFLSLRRGADAR